MYGGEYVKTLLHSQVFVVRCNFIKNKIFLQEQLKDKLNESTVLSDEHD